MKGHMLFSSNDGAAIQWPARSVADPAKPLFRVEDKDLKKKWVPLALTIAFRAENQAKLTDLLYVDAPAVPISYAFSDRAVGSLNPYVKEDCIFLPLDLRGTNAKYWLPWITRIVDCLDRTKAKLRVMSFATQIRTAAFFEERLEGRFMFRVPEDPNKEFVTDAFVNLVRQHRLTGFEFRSGYSSPPLNSGTPQE